jgi:2-keto-4-pentenoate hydratase/2-oxohepta-3-ene-1,7-dioic acid hydratase in catechol pathway
MRLVTYEANGKWRSGIRLDDKVVDSAAAAKTAGMNFDGSEISNRIIIQLSQAEQSGLESAARELAKSNGMDNVLLGPPIPDPDKIICLGLNYKSHAEEAGFQPPEVPILFAKYRNALTGPASPIILPVMSQEIDYEGELAVVIGKRGKDIPVEHALEHVAGYMALHDVSARDLQFRSGQ